MPETTAETGTVCGYAAVSRATTTQSAGSGATPGAETTEPQPTAISSAHAISGEANEKAGLSEAAGESKMRREAAFERPRCRETKHEGGYAAVKTESAKTCRT